MIINILLWPFKKIYEIEQKIVNSLAKTLHKTSTKKENENIIGNEKMLIDFESEEGKKAGKKQSYKYTAKDIDGKRIIGTIEAFSKVEVHSFLLSQGYEVVQIELDKVGTTLGLAQIGGKRKLKAKTLSFFLTQLSTYIKSGITLVDSIKILSRQTKNKTEKKIYQKLVHQLNIGVSFSEALNRQGTTFPRLLINMVKTAEMTGHLSETLDDMAEYYTTMEANRKQIISTLTYPSVIFILAVAVLTFLITYIVPQFQGIYNQAAATLPGITKFIISLSNFMQDNIIIIIVVVAILIVFFVLMYKYITTFRYIVQWVLMHIPVIKSVIIYSEIVTFTKTFASLVKYDVFITDTMEVLKKITNNEIYKNLINDAITNLSMGNDLSVAFKNQWAFPTTAYEMLITGEKTGRLDEMMESVAKYYQDSQKALVTQLKSLIEPALIVFLAGMVGLIVLSIVIPMFDMYQQIG